MDDGLPGEDVYAVAVEDDGTPWIGTMGYGVASLEGETWVVYDLPLTIEDPRSPGEQVDNDAFTDIAIDGAGNKWFATDGSGVAVLDSSNANWTMYETANSGLASDFVQTIHIDPSGNTWFGTLGGGVSRLSADRSSWLTYDSSNTPLPEDDILAVAVDGSEGLWLAAYDAGLAFYGDLPLTPPAFDLDPRGRPEYEPGEIKGYFLWLDPGSYQWTLAWSGEGAEHAFRGEITADAPVTLIETQDLEAGDVAEVAGDTLTIDAFEDHGQDLVTFEFDRAATELTIRLTLDGAYYPFNLRVGGVGARPGTAPFRMTAPQPGAPEVAAGEDRTVSEGDLVVFGGRFTDPDSPTGHTIRWDLGDGTTVEDALSPTHTYPDDGLFNVSLTVTDMHGEGGDDWLTVTVENVAPEVGFYTDPAIPEPGEEVQFNAYLYDAGEEDTHTLEWDFGDGSPLLVTDQLTVTHTYAEEGEYTVTLTGTDDDGGVGEEGATLLVGKYLIPVLVFFDGLEGDVGHWAPTGDWALVEADSYSPAHAWSLNPGGAPQGNTDYVLELRQRILIPSGTSNPELNYFDRLDLASDTTAMVEVSTDDGATWLAVAKFTQSDNTPGWRLRRVALEGFQGMKIRLRLRAVQGSSLDVDLWMVDDVRVDDMSILFLPFVFGDS
jgi:PKD repeat protein